MCDGSTCLAIDAAAAPCRVGGVSCASLATRPAPWLLVGPAPSPWVSFPVGSDQGQPAVVATFDLADHLGKD